MITRNCHLTSFERLLGFVPSASFDIDSSISGSDYFDLKEDDVWGDGISEFKKGIPYIFNEPNYMTHSIISEENSHIARFLLPVHDPTAAISKCNAMGMPSACDIDLTSKMLVSSSRLQSSPVKIPCRPQLYGMMDDWDRFMEVSDDEEWLPPHELLAKQYARSTFTSSSVVEGVGRTLKGRDARKVRDAVWKQTDFPG